MINFINWIKIKEEDQSNNSAESETSPSVIDAGKNTNSQCCEKDFKNWYYNKKRRRKK